MALVTKYDCRECQRERARRYRARRAPIVTSRERWAEWERKKGAAELGRPAKPWCEVHQEQKKYYPGKHASYRCLKCENQYRREKGWPKRKRAGDRLVEARVAAEMQAIDALADLRAWAAEERRARGLV